MGTSLVRIEDEVKKNLDNFKLHHRESFNDVIERLMIGEPTSVKNQGKASNNSKPEKMFYTEQEIRKKLKIAKTGSRSGKDWRI